MLAAHVHHIPPVAATDSLWNTGRARAAAAATNVAEYLRRTVCGLSGHELAWHFEPNRVSLHCLSCGHETPGWTIETSPAYRRDARHRR